MTVSGTQGHLWAQHALASYRVRPSFDLFMILFRLRKVISLVYSILLTARGPFLIQQAPAEPYVFLLPYGSFIKK